MGLRHAGDGQRRARLAFSIHAFISCEVARATTTSGGLVAMSNTWVDNWVNY